MKDKKNILFVVLMVLLLGSFGYYALKTTDFFSKESASTIQDADGNVYGIVEIGEQVWLAQNLNYASHSEGESWCYLDREENCEKYGRLYDGEAAMVACPEGWSLPSNNDWKKLEGHINDSELVGAHLKAEEVWDAQSENLDTYGFRGLPGGHYFDMYFYEIDLGGYWWTSTAEDHGVMWVKTLHENSADLVTSTFSPDHGFSVRCIKD